MFTIKLKNNQNLRKHLVRGLCLVHASFFLRVSDAAVPPPVSGSSEHPYFSLTKQTKHTDTRLCFFFSYILSFTPYFTGASKAFMRGQEHHISLNVWVLRMLSVILHAQLYVSHALVLHFSHVWR